MAKYILALDQGTTSSRAILFTKKGCVHTSAQKELSQIFPSPGHVEHDPEAIWKTQLATARSAVKKAKANPGDIAAIGITNQRETVVLWEKATGKPIHNAIVWQSRITVSICDTLQKDGLEKTFQKKSGLVLDPYFSGTKIKYLLDKYKGLRKRAEKGEILAGTIDTYLLWRLTGGRVHATDYSNASRTLIFNIHTLKWDAQLLKILDIPKAMLPEVKPSSGIFGETDPKLFGATIPIAGIAGDQQAATFGQGCFKPGMVKNTYGTGCFMLMNTGAKAVASKNGLLTTIGWGLDSKVTYCLEGSVFVAGAAVQWLRDGLKLIKTAPAIEKLALSEEDNGGVYFVPAFVG
ncbi:MAG: glycerol kinase GlpK, partial [Candidatus Hydrogenedentes bacterium]|nr:glycerol kinase GlpK [Candidatus Hydrogenedentota bacterium]